VVHGAGGVFYGHPAGFHFLFGGLLHAPVHDGADPVLLTATLPAARPGPPPSEQAAAAVTSLGRAGISVSEFALGQPSLDEVFLALTGQPGTTT
jgi:daunorubicin/doxorubicin transport system ATP-binding protein